MAAIGPARPDDPRARAAQTKRDRTRRALLDAAESTFATRGWANTRMEDVAVAAGVSPATAYNHFPTKHALLGHIFGPLVRPLFVQATVDAQAGRPVVDALSDQVRALARIRFRNQKLTAAFSAAVAEYTIKTNGPPSPGDDSDPRTLAPLPEALTLLVEHGQRTGELHSYPPAPEVGALVVNTLLLRSINRQYEPPEQTAEFLLTILFGLTRPELLAWPGAADRPFRGGR